MKNKFQSKTYPQGTRTIWRYLGALFILFTFAIGNVMAEGTTAKVIATGDQYFSAYTEAKTNLSSNNWVSTSGGPGNSGSSYTAPSGWLDGGSGKPGYGMMNVQSGKTVIFTVTNITGVSILGCSNNTSSRTINLSVKTGGVEVGTVATKTTSSTSTPEVLTYGSTLDKTKTYTVTVSASSGNNAKFMQIKFVGAAESAVCPETLTISSKDSKTAFTEGDAIELTAALAKGNGSITYQWYKGGTAEGNKLTGKTTNKLQIASCTTSDAGDYFCVASKTSCPDAVNASAFAITVEADTKCFNMPAITSKPSNLPSVVVTGGTLSDVSVSGKTVAMDGNGLKFGGNDSRLKVTLTGASIIAGTKITVAWKGASAGSAGVGLFNENLASQVISVSGGEAAGSVSHTFTAEEAANYADEFIINRNASGSGICINAITVEDCGPAVTKHTVTLNYNDGETPAGSLPVVDGNAAVKPADPTRGKYTFLGWFVGDTDTEYVWSTAVTDDITLKAHWQDPWTLTFDADGGSAVANVTVKHNTKAEKPADPTKDDYDFMGWYYGTPAVAFDWDANVTQNYALVAHWESAVAKYDVEYYDGDTKIGTEPQVWANQHPTAAGINTNKPLYTFAGWYTSSILEGDPVALNTVTPVEGLKLYGKWTKAYATSYDMEAYAAGDGASKAGLETALTAAGYAYTNIDGIDNGHTHNYTYDGMKYKTNDGDLSFNVVAGKVVEVKTGHLPTNDAVTMYINGVADATVFEGADEAQETHKINYFYSAAEALYRLEVLASKGTCSVKKITIRDPYQVSYDPHGADAIAPQYGTPSVTLPTPANGTGVFKGWYDAETEGNKIGNAGASYTPTANITLHAQWETVSSDNTLSDLQVDGATVAGFDPAVQIYNLVYEYGQQPVITSATATAGALATVTINNTPVEEATFKYVQVKVEAESGAERFYQVRYTNKPKQGATIFKAELTAANDADYSGMYADGDNSEIKLADDGANGYKFSGTSNYVKMAIADATFAEGDMLKMTYTTNPQQGELAIYDGTTKVQGTPYTNNILTFSDAVGDNKSTLFIRRTSDNNFNGWVAEVEVQRYMAPIIKSYKIGEVAGTINQDLKTIAIELPYGTTLSGVAATIEAYANGGATVTAPTPLAYDTPLGYKVSSAYAEDGDVDYTVTITEADHYEAMIVGGESYTTLAAAVAAAAGKTVKLLDNVDLMATGLEIGVNMTLDLNGFNIKAGEQIDNDILVPAGKKLTLVDNSANAEGKIYTEQAYTGAVTGYGLIRVAGELLMQSGNIYAVIDSDPANLGQFAVVIAAGGKVTVEGGQIKAGWYAISNNGLNSGSTIIVSGGELISTADFAIYNPAKESTVTVSGGVVYGAAGGIAMNRGELTVTGGTITSKDQGSTGTWGDGTGDLSNAAIAASGKYESVEVEISGGTIIAEGTAVMITNGTTNPVEVAISGGQFSHVVPAEYCAEGFAPVTEPNAQGKYEVEDKRIYIFDGSTMTNMATSPSGAIAWEIVGSTMGAGDKDKTYEGVHYTRALSCGSSSTTKHFRIDVALNNAAKIEVIGMSNSNSGDSKIRHAWLTNSTDKGEIANAIASLESDGYNPEYFATDWLEEGSYYLHSDNTVNIFLIRVTSKEVDPKCEQPTITTQPATDLTFGAGNMTATVVAEVSDGGTLKYQWYNASDDSEVVGATAATLSTTDEGTYYVIVTNTLAEHRDNSIKSDNATLAHRVLNDATLSALGYGDPATAIALEADKYDYRVDLAMGTIDVPELTATATMAPYPVVAITNATEFVNYEATSTVLVTAEDGVTQKTYTVKFVVDHVYTALVDVTESTTWNWSGSTEATINDVANKGLILANYIDGANFEMIEGKENERARRNQNGGVYQGTHLHFNTTVAGKVKFYFRAPSGGENCTITVINNGKEMVAGTRGNSFGWSKEIVVKGDVVIEMMNDKEGGGDTRVQQIVFTEVTPDYTRNVTNNIGTLCVNHNVLVGGAQGATFYQIASRNELYDFKIDFEEVLPNEELKAGEPYIFQSTTGRIDLYYGATVADAPVAVRGMIGSFANTTLDITEENKSDILYIAENKLWNCEDLVASDLEVVANRAYIVMSDVPTYAEYTSAPQQNNPAPRRRVTLGRNGENTATGIDAINATDKPMKLIIDGNIFIIRGEKMYDVTGKLVK